MEKNNTGYKVMLTILIIALLGLVSYIVYDKMNTDKTVNNDNNAQENSKVEEISIDSLEVKTISEKFRFSQNVLASIYKSGNFTASTISNDLILRAAWTKYFESNIDNFMKDGTATYVGGDDEFEWKIPEQSIADSIKTIFGDIKYNNESFVPRDNQKTPDGLGPIFSRSNFVKYENNNYIYKGYYGGGGQLGLIINEKIYKTTKQDDVIEIYVRTSFGDLSINLEEVNGHMETYSIYKNFDFTNQEFVDFVVTLFDDDKIKDEQWEKLNTYIYTYKFDKDTNDYYLTGFRKQN